MYQNVIFFKGTERLAAIMTEEPIVLGREVGIDPNSAEFLRITDAITTEVTQFRPADVLRINTVDEALVKKPEARESKKPKNMTIS